MHVLKKIGKEISWASFVLVRKTKSKVFFVKRLLLKPKLPQNHGVKIFIHLGCGDIVSPEFINVDVRPAPHVHYVCDATDLSIFADKYADLVYACHLLEHIPRCSLRKVLWEWRRVLKPGGILRLSVPDFDALLDIYQGCNRDIDSIAGPLIGGQDGTWNFHRSVFNLEYLSRLLTEVGFRSVREWIPEQVEHHDFDDWASKTIERGGKKYRISLNVEAVK